MKAELSTVVSSEMESASAVHVTTDIWSSITNEPYISVTASFITDDWRLVARTLANAAMEERHTQANIAARLNEAAYACQRAGRGDFSSTSQAREGESKDSVLKVPAVNRRISVTVAGI